MPQRIRQVHQARLEARGIWTTPGSEPEEECPKRFGVKEEPKKEDPKQTFKSAFQRERVSHLIDCSSLDNLIRSEGNRS